jgi:hypothetical protein
MDEVAHRDTRGSDRSTCVRAVSPRDGDVVVTRESQCGVHYTVRQLPGIVQFSIGMHDDAVRLAGGFGRRYRVDVWLSDARTYRLIEAHRLGTEGHR